MNLNIAEAKITTLKVKTEEIIHIKFWDLKMVKYESENIKCKIWGSHGGVRRCNICPIEVPNGLNRDNAKRKK